MFIRLIESTANPGKARELVSVIAEQVLPMLRTRSGFLDELVLLSEQDPNRVVTLSFWKSKEDAERYHREDFPKVIELVKPHVDREPRIEPLQVHTSTMHRIAAGKAA